MNAPLLAPLGVAYGLLAALRVHAYRSGWRARARLSGPVISVGNLSVGGTGKTPVVAWVAGVLHDAGLPVAVLSRGYAGSFPGEALVVSDGGEVRATATLAGDEPVMLARRLPGVVVAVGRHREVVGRFVEARFGRRVHVLDDGFQHLRLHRDLDLLCLDAAAAPGWPLPAGPFREFASAASRADMILLTQADRVSSGDLDALARRHGLDRALAVGGRIEGIRALDGSRVARPAAAFALSGIAGPVRFEADLAACVTRVVGARRFPDHHAFRPAEIDACDAEARRLGADAVVTTEKDAVRLESLADAPGPGRLPIRVLRINAEPREPERLRRRLLAVARTGLGSEKAAS